MLDKPMLGVSVYARPKGDFFATPEWVTEVLCRHVGLRDAFVWEPACGEGHMSRVLAGSASAVHSTDLYDRGFGDEHGRSFFDYEEIPTAGRQLLWPHYAIITNPPFSLADEFVEHAIKLARSARQASVAMLLRNEWDCAASRSQLFTADAGFNTKIVLTKRPRWIEGTKGSPRHSFAWYVWDFSGNRPDPRIIYDQ